MLRLIACRRWLFALPLWLVLGCASASSETPPVAIGFFTPVIREVSRKDVEVSLRFWIEELARSLGLTYKPVQFYDDGEAMRRDMASGRINFVVSTSLALVRHFPLEELANGFAGYKNSPDNLILVVRRDSGIQRPEDFSGKRICLLEGDELSDLYLETLMLKAWGKVDWERLGPVSRELRSSKLAHRMFFGQADAALLYRSGYDAALALNPQIGQRLNVIEAYTFKIRSPHIGLFSTQVRPEHREQIIQAALKLNETARGRQVLQIYQADNITRTQVRDLEPLRELLESHRALMARVPGKAAAGRK